MDHVDGLGTRLRQLVAALDGAVEQVYRDHQLDFRPRFYPYFCLLLEYEELTVGEFVTRLGFTQPAVTQTLNVMHKAGLVGRAATKDKRERRYALTDKAMAMLPILKLIWTATAAAAQTLERSLPTPLRHSIDVALAQLAHEPFGQLIEKELER
jgi:MarR family transcriptional regulator, organic hydroperoxide resistance regulator